MKTKFIFFLFIIICSVTRVIAQYPIPSYNVDVTQKASFQEQIHMGLINPLTLGKREINVSVHPPTLPIGSLCGGVWVYSLDKRDVLGPFDLISDQTLQVLIDDRAWGVYIEVSVELLASVWIDGGL